MASCLSTAESVYCTSPRARRPREELETGEGPGKDASEVDLIRAEREARCFSGEGDKAFLIDSAGRMAAWEARFCLVSVDLRKLVKLPFHHCGSAVCEGSK